MNFTVSLKHGDDIAAMRFRAPSVDALLGFEAGETKIGSGTTEADEAGIYTSIKVARAVTMNGNMVLRGRRLRTATTWIRPRACTAVSWNPQSFTHPAMTADPPAVLNEATTSST